MYVCKDNGADGGLGYTLNCVVVCIFCSRRMQNKSAFLFSDCSGSELFCFVVVGVFFSPLISDFAETLGQTLLDNRVY